MHPSDRTYRNQTVRISELTVISDTIERITFENCQIEGPAILVLLGETTISGNGFDGDWDSLVWPISTSRQRVIGAVALVDCTVVGCQLRRIGLAVPEDQIKQVRTGFGETG